VNLDAMSAEDEKIIQLCDEWDFEVASVKPAGAFYSLKFEGDKLSAISYRRARVRVD